MWLDLVRRILWILFDLIPTLLTSLNRVMWLNCLWYIHAFIVPFTVLKCERHHQDSPPPCGNPTTHLLSIRPMGFSSCSFSPSYLSSASVKAAERVLIAQSYIMGIEQRASALQSCKRILSYQAQAQISGPSREGFTPFSTSPPLRTLSPRSILPSSPASRIIRHPYPSHRIPLYHHCVLLTFI